MPAGNIDEEINKIILSCLIENSRMSSQNIHKKLKSHGINRTSRAILERINKLEKSGRIAGYTLKNHPNSFEGSVIRIILISFKTSPVFKERLEMFTNYLQNAPFVAFAGRTIGEYDWINIKIFPNARIANQESDMYRTAFGDIVDKYTAFDVTISKAPEFIKATNYAIEDFKRFCKAWAN
jgi:DNA-binding Lrp family transcriptional regulator